MCLRADKSQIYISSLLYPSNIHSMSYAFLD